MLTIRAVNKDDHAQWLPLWDGYNAFYGRHGESALDARITEMTWARFFDPAEPLFCLVAEQDGQLKGLTHFLYHRSTTRLEPVIYLQDLFTRHEARGQGVARALIEGVVEHARGAGIKRVYWQTHDSNSSARALYDKLARHDGFIVYGINLTP